MNPHPPDPGPPYAPYPPPQPPKKSLGTGAIVAIVLGSIFGALLLLGIIGAAVSGGTDSNGDTEPKRTAPAEAGPAPEKPAVAPAEEKPEKAAEIEVTAKKTTFKPGILHDGGAYTSVTVTVANKGGRSIPVNPLYFTITDTGGGVHTQELGRDERQIDTVDLAPGEHITGVVTGEGGFTPAYVTYAPGLLGKSVRGEVS
ncbi:DUF4352 domain-containing protein [Streptomyces sp. TRM49041]|uniref:DUF4352 domain-containing protein n=1 Tax=Streptomyces sp. TRM49041 TaxID=2603216 RepID=UPI0011ED1A63|nr:DUF4352 domain-containing protein [Streptomyces sp. TRM49041]